MANLVTDGFDWFPSGKNVATRSALWAADSFYKVNFDAQGAPSADVTTGRFNFGKARDLHHGGIPGGPGLLPRNPRGDR
jgi:hypothetical protein